jgi:hypothetical protein
VLTATVGVVTCHAQVCRLAFLGEGQRPVSSGADLVDEIEVDPGGSQAIDGGATIKRARGGEEDLVEIG